MWQLPFPVVFDEFGSLSPERKRITGKPHRGCDYNGLDPKTKKNKPMTVGEAIVAEATFDDFGSLDKNVQQDTIKKVYSQYVALAKDELLRTMPSVTARAESAKARLPIYGNP